MRRNIVHSESNLDSNHSGSRVIVRLVVWRPDPRPDVGHEIIVVLHTIVEPPISLSERVCFLAGCYEKTLRGKA